MMDAHGEHIEQLLPEDEDLHTQQPAMRSWYEHFDESDVAWCVGEAAGAYGLLAAGRVGAENVVVFQADIQLPVGASQALESTVQAVSRILESTGYGGVPVESMSVLGWQRHGVVDAYSDDPIGEVVAATAATGRPSCLLLDVPGYGGGFLSTLSIGEQGAIESVLLKTTDTLAQSQLEDAGFETVLVAERDGVHASWRRALVAHRGPDDAIPEIAERASEQGGRSADATTARDESEAESWHAPFLARERARGEWRLRDIGYLTVAGVLYVLAGVFKVLAVVFDVLAKSPLRRIAGRALVGLLIAGLFVLFLVVLTVIAELGQFVGVSDQAAGAAAGGLVLAIPVMGALFFLKLAIES